ncbi:MAG: short-chain dehydrogenase [Acidimicrobiaceae bacterium]|nr:short-chain dehydrogenase [Acidimicrobiaceae bacterium]
MTSPEAPPRRVVVTGAARGIGASIAAAFVAAGDQVVLLDRSAVVADTAADLGAKSVTCDLADPVDARRGTAEAIDTVGGVDVLVNNAGVFEIVPLLEIDADQWSRMFDVNTRSMLLTIQVAARRMIEQGTGGRIVNMASMGGKDGEAGQAHYAASKAAVISLTQVAAKELGAHQITVNSICPGYVLTEMGADTRTPEMVAGWSAKSPLGRCGSPDDVAAMAVHLASPSAAYLTGQAFNVTGGMIMH